MSTKNTLLNAYTDERASALLYETMAQVENDPRLAEVYRRIAKTELRHADKWADKARESGLVLQEYKTSDQKLGHLNILDMGNGKQRIELDATLDHELAVQVREKIELMFSSIIAEVEQSKGGNES